MATVFLDAVEIKDSDSFHAAFEKLIGFPHFYGKNGDAWIDCMSSLADDEPMSAVRLGADELLIIEVFGFEAFFQRLPDLAKALLSWTASVNRRYANRAVANRIALVPIDRR
jgi:hypothetical protein